MDETLSLLLKIGARVSFNGYDTDRGTVKATNGKYITVAWDDGHVSYTGHSNMKRVELASLKPIDARK
jgi:hypothetical protein